MPLDARTERILSRNARALYAIDDTALRGTDDRDTWIDDIGPAARTAVENAS